MFELLGYEDFKGHAALKFSEFLKEFPDAHRTQGGWLNTRQRPNSQETLEKQNKQWDQIFAYVRRLIKAKQDSDARISELNDEHSRSMKEAETRLNEEHAKKIKQKDREYKQLMAQLMDNQGDHKAWPDDVLKDKFNVLRLSIETVTAPSNQEFAFPEDYQLGSHLDPTSFVARVGRGRSYFLLRHIIWNIIHEQFFSAPFGFGAIGPGTGQAKLTHLYYTWRELLDGPVREGLPEKDSFPAFHRDQLANDWRSATFQSLSAELARGDEYPSRLGSPIAKISAENLSHTTSRLLGFLSEVAGLSNSTVTREVEEQVGKIAKLAFEIALHFGIHPAQLRLSVPHRGEEVRIGGEYHHCKNAALNAGTVYVVDLVTLPGLLKIGDGRSDMSSKRVIVPCEIYPEHPST